MSLRSRKPTIWVSEQTNQLGKTGLGRNINRYMYDKHARAHSLIFSGRQRLCFRYTDSTLASVTVLIGLYLTKAQLLAQLFFKQHNPKSQSDKKSIRTDSTKISILYDSHQD